VDDALVSAGSLFAIIILCFEIWEEREREDLLFAPQKRAFTLLGEYIYIYYDDDGWGHHKNRFFKKIIATLDIPKIEFITIIICNIGVWRMLLQSF
jgi:hypothetical protein